MSAPAEPTPPDAPSKPDAPDAPVAPATAAARIGWLLGGLVGLALGFVATWGLETQLLRGRVADPTAVASRASSALVGGLFLAGALTGHAFGARGGAGRTRMLASALGTVVAVALWATLVMTR